MPRTTRAGLFLLAPVLALSSMVAAQGSPSQFALESIAGLRLHNVTAEPATLQGRKGIRVTMSRPLNPLPQEHQSSSWPSLRASSSTTA